MTVTLRSVAIAYRYKITYIAWSCIATYIATSITGQPVRATTNTFSRSEIMSISIVICMYSNVECP